MLLPWKDCCAGIAQRWIFAVMGCLALTSVYAMRVSLSLAITEMVVTSGSSHLLNSEETCTASVSTTTNSSNSGSYKWNEQTKGIVLSSFYWGYLVTQIPGGILADKFGGKWTLTYGLFSSSILTLLTPVIVKAFDSTGLIIIRVLIGLGEGMIFPSLNVLVARWAPPNERSKIGTVVQTGAQVGTILGNALSGVLIQNSSLGWEIVFFVFGSAGLIWCFVWVFLCHNSPETHPFISDKEKKYLRDATTEWTHAKTPRTPWKHLLASPPLWALLAGKIGHDWGFFTMVTDLPLYMSNVLNFSIQTNGFLTALPYIAMWAIGVLSSWLADWLIKANKLSTTNVRKICTTSAAIFPAIFIIAASYAGCDRTVVVILFTFGMGTMGSFYPGVMVNGVDLSPNYSGIVMAMMTAVGALAGIVAPYVVGILTPNQTLSEWRIVFWITFVILIVSSLLFDIWADGEVQYWNDPEFQNEKKRAKEDVEKADDVCKESRNQNSNQCEKQLF